MTNKRKFILPVLLFSLITIFGLSFKTNNLTVDAEEIEILSTINYDKSYIDENPQSFFKNTKWKFEWTSEAPNYQLFVKITLIDFGDMTSAQERYSPMKFKLMNGREYDFTLHYSTNSAEIVIDVSNNDYNIRIVGIESDYGSSSYENLFFDFQHVLDLEPVIGGETAFVTNVDNPFSVNEIKSHLTAIDNEDGDISHLIQVDNDDYTENKHKTGTYSITYSVTDSAGNTAYLTVHVLVRDITPPVITGQSEYTQSMSQRLPLDEIKDNLNVSDNYNENLSPQLVSDDYTENYNKPGTYEMNYRAVDTSGNESTFKVTINVVDDIKPVISGPTNIVKGQNETLTTNDILADLTANDNHDGNITDKIKIVKDNYAGNGNKIGEYTITFEVSDSSFNKSTHIVTVQVKDNIPPVFYVDNYFITVEQSINLTQQDFINLLTATGQINPTSTTTFSTIYDEYTGNEKEIGMYAMTFKTKSTDGREDEISVVVNVTEANDDDSTIIEPEAETGLLLTIWGYITTFLGWIWTGLKWLGNGFLWLLEKFLNLFK